MPDQTGYPYSSNAFYIALVGELRTPGTTNAKQDPNGECREIRAANTVREMLDTAVQKGLSLTFFFTVYVIKNNGETMAVEDFSDLSKAINEWPDADVRCPALY